MEQNQNPKEKGNKAAIYDGLDADFKIEDLDEDDFPRKPYTRDDGGEAAAFSKSTIVHIVFLALIILVAAVSVWKLYRWNKGTQPDSAPLAPDTEYETNLDEFVPNE